MNSFSLSKLNTILENLKYNPSEKFESESIEFKGYRNLNALKEKVPEIVLELVSFANKHGGLIIIGVVDSSSVKNEDWPSQLEGIDCIDTDELQKKICGKLRPAIDLTVTNYEFEEKNYIVIEISHRVDTLVSTSNSKYYIRRGRDSVPMEPLQVENAVKNLQQYDWSQDIIEVENIDDCLDHDSLDSALEEYINIREFNRKPSMGTFLESIGVTINSKLTKGGLLFLGNDQSIIKYIGKIEYRVSKKEKGGKLPINEVWNGSLWKAIEKVRILFDKIIQYKSFTHNNRTFTYPTMDKIAFDEAFINSLVHRDYISGDTVSIDFTQTNLIISNPGSFFGGIDPENIFIHQPKHRNKSLSSIFLNFKLMDKAGQGVRRMMINSLKYGRKQPLFVNKSNTIEVVFELDSINKDLFAATSSFTNYDVVELIIIDELQRNLKVNIAKLFKQLKPIYHDPWIEIKHAIQSISYIDIKGDPSGIYLEKKDKLNFFQKLFKKKKKEENFYIKIFEYLMKNDTATVEDLKSITNILNDTLLKKTLDEIKFIDKSSNQIYSLKSSFKSKN